jgi:hypothetical protein
MKTFALRGGDLVLQSGSYAMATGHEKIHQDLRCALLEPVGNDRFHPAYGSQIDRFIGGLADEQTAFLVRQEIARVLSNYVAIQQDRISRDLQAGAKSRFVRSEIIANIDDIAVSVVDDTARITISIRTMEGSPVTLNTEVGV